MLKKYNYKLPIHESQFQKVAITYLLKLQESGKENPWGRSKKMMILTLSNTFYKVRLTKIFEPVKKMENA